MGGRSFDERIALTVPSHSGTGGLRELAVALDQLSGSQRDLRFKTLLLTDNPLEFDPLQPQSVADQAESG